MRAFVVALLGLAACTPPSTPAAAPQKTQAPSSDVPIIPAEAPPLLIEYVAIDRRWVERVLPVPPEAANDEAREHAYRESNARALTEKLAAEIVKRFAGSAPARAAIADATLAVLGERAVDDAGRPAVHAMPRANVDRVRLPAAAKAALVTFARGARGGDVIPSPAVDGDVVLVARARANVE